MKKEMVRKVLVLILSVVMVISCVGCQKQEAKTANEITVWTENVAISSKMLEDAIAGFNEKYPDIKVNFEIFPGADRASKFALAKESKTLPTLFLGSTFAFADEIHKGSVAPLTDVVEKHKSNLLESSYKGAKFGDDYYYMPTSNSYFGLLYNADYFKAAGLEKFVPSDGTEITNWDFNDFENEILPKLRDSFVGTDKYPLVMFAGNEQADTHMLNMMKVMGGNVFKDSNLVAGKDSKTIEGLTKLKEWMDKGYTNSNVSTKLGTEAGPDFQNMKSAINMGQYTNYLTFKKNMAEGKCEKFDLRVATVPGKDGNILTAYTSAFFLMNVEKEEQESGKLFLNYLYGEGEKYLAPIQNTGIPVSKTLNAEASKNNKMLASYAENDKYSYDFTGGTPGYVGTRKYLFPALQSVFSGAKDAATALAIYQEQGDKIVAEFKKNSAVLNK